MLRILLLYKWYLAIAAIIVATGIGYQFFSSDDLGYETAIAKRGEVRQITSLNGKVVANEAANLTFETSGRVNRITKKVGDTVNAGEVIVALANDGAYAEVLSAEASLQAEQARLNELILGARPEEIAALESKVNRLTISKEDTERRKKLAEEKGLTDVKQSLAAVITAAGEGVSKGKNALMTLADVQYANITITLSDDLRLQDAKTIAIRALFNRDYGADFRSDVISTLSGGIFSAVLGLNEEIDPETSIVAKAKEAETALTKVKLALEAIPLHLNLSTSDKANIAAEKSAVGAAITTLSSRIEDIAKTKAAAAQGIVSAESELTNAINNLEAAKNDLLIKKAGSSKQDIETQQAIVRGAEARVRLQRAQYQKTLITAPFSGIVAKIDTRLQESVSTNKEVVSIIGSGQFAIEAFIPEADIAKVKAGDIAEVTLDAYQKDAVFSARVATIDTTETIIEGVTTYKVKLVFDNEDPRIRSGMTANLDIIGESKSDAIVVPERAIKRSSEGKTVRVVKEGVIKERKIETGIRGANGMTEVVNGIIEGEEVIVGSK